MVSAATQLILHCAVVSAARVNEHLLRSVVGQTGLGCWWFVLRVCFTVIYHRKMCFNIFTTFNIIKLCQIVAWILQIFLMVNTIVVAVICTLIILNGRLLEFCQASGPIEICQLSLRSILSLNCFIIIFCLGSADRYSWRIVFVVTGARAVAGNRNCGWIYFFILPAVGMGADSKIKCMCCM